MKINNHQLEGTNISYKQTPNTSGKFAKGLPDTIIIHYTAGASASSSVRTLTNPNVKASAHLVVGKKGEIIQLAKFDTIAWHAGKSSYDERTGFNKYSIGIEIDNAGALEKREDGGFYSWFNKKYPESEVVHATHRNETTPRYWHAYTEKQIETVFAICRLLKEKYAIQYILGHEEIAPKRKIDPGPAFPLERLRNNILSGRDEDGSDDDLPEVGEVTASKLNIRSTPTAKGKKVAEPLPKGSKVKIIGEQNGWYKVTASIEGWVSGKYIK